jgi:site-specific DNA recombinase
MYVDNDISAYSGKPRPEYKRLLADIEAGRIQVVVVWHLDRLHRQPKELESFIDLVERHGVSLASVSGDHDLSTPEGRLYARILGAVARMESEHKSRRIRRKIVELRRAGKPHVGGTRPYGFEKDRVTVIQSEAEVLREAMERVLANESLRSICSDFNSRGLRTSRNRLWSPSTLTRTLQRAHLAGMVEHRETGKVKGKWPAIITEQEHQRLLALLRDPRRKTGGGAPVKHLLSGILRCGECGTGLIAAGGRHGRAPVYWCQPRPERGCGKVVVVRHRVETFVINGVLGALSKNHGLGAVRSMERDDQADVESVMAGRLLLEELARAYSSRKITMQEWLAARGPIEARIEDATSRVASRTRQAGVEKLVGEEADLAALWESLDLDRRRAVIKGVLEGVIVNRVGKRRGPFDGSRLMPMWRAWGLGGNAVEESSCSLKDILVAHMKREALLSTRGLHPASYIGTTKRVSCPRPGMLHME